MGLKKDFSVVADSDMASPRSSVSSPAPIKRAAITYGRRRDPDISFTSEQDSKDSIYRTGPPDLSDEVPPSEMSRMMGSDDDAEDESVDGDILPSSLNQPKFTFGWREKLRQIDDEGDLNGHTELKGIDTSVSASREQVALHSPSHVATDIDSPVKTRDGSTLKNTRSEDIFAGSLSSVSSPSHSRDSKDCSSPGPSRNQIRPSTNIVAPGDETDQESVRDSRPSSPTTSPSHLIATPKSQLASSPPTSHGDGASANSTSSSASKGKGKAFRARRTVVPLRFDSHRPESFDNLEPTVRRQRSFDNKEKKQKIKAPTKKELRETARERARIAAERTVSIPKVANSENRSLAGFFAKIAKQQGHVQSDVLRPSTEPPSEQHLSSPIGSFSSSQPQLHEHGLASRSATTRQTVTSSRQSPSPQRPTPGDVQLVADNESDCDEHPNADSLLDSSETKIQLEAAKRQSLATLKQHLVKMQNLKPKSKTEDEDDELEVLPRTKIEEQRDSRQAKQLSKGRRMLLANAHITTKPLDPRKLTEQEFDHFQEDILTHGVSDPRVLTTVMRQRAERESMGIVKQKEEEFVRLGGVVKKESVPVDKLQGHQIRLEYAMKGMESWSREDNDSETAGTDDEDDPDWVSETRGSMRPEEEDQDSSLDPEELAQKGTGDEGTMEDDQGVGPVQRSSQLDEDVPAPKVKTRRYPPGRIIDSDDSDSGEYSNVVFSKPAKPLYAVSSSDDRTEDENDKENNTRLMFDHSEDKENKAVVRHQMPGGMSGPARSLRSVFDDASDFDHEISFSPPHALTFDLEVEEGQVSDEKREPLLSVRGDGVTSPQRSPTTVAQGLAIPLKRSPPTCGSPHSVDALGPTPSAPAPTLDFAPVFGGDDVSEKKATVVGFSQFSQEGPGFGAPTGLRPGFADLFESNTQEGGLRREKSLGLTQDVALQPAFQVDEKLLRKADAIFEKEQEYLVEVTGKKSTKEPEFYVNEVGFLTQTRPSGSGITPGSPLVFSPTQTSFQDQYLGLTQTQLRSSITLQSQSRPPLRTISLSSTQFSPGTSPKRRLRKRRGTVTPQASPARSSVPNTILSTSPPPQRLNAFDILGKRPRHGNGKSNNKSQGKEARSMERDKIRDYVMDEAEESDEDQGIGFGLVKKRDKEEDEDGVDMDASLPELVDDRKMDAETEGVEKVLEKHIELLGKDDEESIKFHQGVAQGELRKKRKGQFGIDDSDEEDEEDDRARKIRRKMKERPERGDIQALVADEKTAAFANVYNAGIHDDEVINLRPFDIEHDLRTGGEDDDGEDILASDDQDEQGDLEDRDQENEGKRFVTYRDIQAEARRMKEHPQEEVESLDLEDVSWIEEPVDADEMDLDVPVITNEERIGGATTAKSTSAGEWRLMGMGGIRRKENEKDLERSRAWAKSESRNTTGTTGRVVGGIAVTGHSSSRAKSGGGSLRSKALASASAASSISSLSGKKPLKSSVLTNLSKRKDQFK